MDFAKRKTLACVDARLFSGYGYLVFLLYRPDEKSLFRSGTHSARTKELGSGDLMLAKMSCQENFPYAISKRPL
jgi:hypothetical protein